MGFITIIQKQPSLPTIRYKNVCKMYDAVL